jgi:hypothetical protein
MTDRSAITSDIVTVGLISLAAVTLCWLLAMIWGIC